MMQILPWKGRLFFVLEMIRNGDTDSLFSEPQRKTVNTSRANPYVNFWLIFDVRASEKFPYVKIWRIFDVRRFQQGSCSSPQGMALGIAP
jgi:hypothetical protein